jgi:two-component sensor histidine kinase
VETNFYVTMDPTTGAPLEILAISRDVGGRKKAEEMARALEASLRVSEARTKAMLEVISNLLGLQAMHVSDAGARDALAESRSLVQAIALLHERLCQSADLAHVGFDGYARALVENLSVAHAAAERQISVAVDAEPIELAVDKALPCGLILNELVGNALKHAFPAGKTGSVRVSLRRTGPEHVELQVGDDGVGLPADLDPAALGHGLVFTLARRLGAEIDVKREKGTAIVIRFAGG